MRKCRPTVPLDEMVPLDAADVRATTDFKHYYMRPR